MRQWLSEHLWFARVYAIILLIFAAAVFVHAFTIVPNTIQINEAQVFSQSRQVPLTIITAYVSLNFTGTGGVSVNNPIHVHAIISQVNVTTSTERNGKELTYYDDCLEFSNGVYPTPQFSREPTSYGTEFASCLPIEPYKNGMFIAQGDVVWHVDGLTYLLLSANGTSYSSGQTNNGSPILDIQPESDTLTTQFNYTTQVLTYVLVGFSILMLQPIGEAIATKK